MAYTVRYSPRAAKQLAALPAAVQVRLLDRTELLAEEPRGPGVVKLKDPGSEPIYRVRAGRDYRALFTVDDARREVTVVAVGPRKDVYRRR